MTHVWAPGFVPWHHMDPSQVRPTCCYEEGRKKRKNRVSALIRSPFKLKKKFLLSHHEIRLQSWDSYKAVRIAAPVLAPVHISHHQGPQSPFRAPFPPLPNLSLWQAFLFFQLWPGLSVWMFLNHTALTVCSPDKTHTHTHTLFLMGQWSGSAEWACPLSFYAL